MPASDDTVVGTFVVEEGDDEDRPDWWCLYLDADDGTRWPFHVVDSDADLIVRAEGIHEYSDNPMAEPDRVLGTGERTAVTVDGIGPIADWGPLMSPCGADDDSVINASHFEARA